VEPQGIGESLTFTQGSECALGRDVAIASPTNSEGRSGEDGRRSGGKRRSSIEGKKERQPHCLPLVTSVISNTTWEPTKSRSQWVEGHGDMGGGVCVACVACDGEFVVNQSQWRERQTRRRDRANSGREAHTYA
jgi:hypothetical protein